MGYLRVQVFPFAVLVEVIFIGDFCLYLFSFNFKSFFSFFLKKKKKSPGCFMFITPANGCCSDDSQSACRGKNR